MQNKHIKRLAIALTALTVVTGCGANETNTEASAVDTNVAETVTESTIGEDGGTDAVVDDMITDGESDGDVAYRLGIPTLTEYVSEEGYAEATTWNSCDDRALAAVMRKAEAGEKVTIACIGGSITQGTISNGKMDSDVPFKKSYADLFFEWWKTTYPGVEFECINAGIGATDSYLGVHRVQKDVLDYNPDLVLVEFSVNDDGSSTCKTNYDNLVRRILLSDSKPAVMLLFMGQTNGANAQNQHVLVGFNYQLPMVSYANYISYAMANGDFTAKDLSGDEVHPSGLGHAITGELLWKYLNSVFRESETMEAPEVFATKGITKDMYLNSEILDSLSLTPDAYGSFEDSSVFQQFPNDWTTTEGEGGITFTVDCTRLGIMYYRTTDGKSGQFEVYVDGELQTSLNGDFSGGWGNYAESRAVYSGDAGEHVVEIKKAPQSEAEGFTILGLLVAH